MQITVPMGGTNVIPEGEGPSRDGSERATPLSQRKSLHTVRLAAPNAPEYKPEWTDKMQLKWRPVEQPEEPAVEEQVVESTVPRGNGAVSQDTGTEQPYDALTREIAELKQTMRDMAQGQLQQPQQPQGPQPPNPDDFDFFEPTQVAEFHRKNNEYIQATVQQSVQAALAPHEGAMQAAEYTRQYNSVFADYGLLADGSENLNFKPLMEKALQLVAQTGGQVSIPDAYDRMELEARRKSQFTSPHQAASSQNAKPAQRTLTAQEAATKGAQAHSLPQRNGVSGSGDPGLPLALQKTDCLGRIIFHNQQHGRARPI